MAKKKFRVRVLLRQGVLDVQGKAIEASLPELGISNISEVRVGKTIEFQLEPESTETGDDGEAALLKKVCEELFSNPVIESYEVEEVR
ncbi:MAG: phosphoribosylformylglycinamidine synthase subunit PurS [Bdellovibrionota bacterium]|jgi:phosphoribosylformylglycinamidine synthase